MHEAIYQQVLTALNLVVLQRLDAHRFRVVSPIPDWYAAFFPELSDDRSDANQPFDPQDNLPDPQNDSLNEWQDDRSFNRIQSNRRLGAVFPFLEHFIEEAEAFWQSGDRPALKSGFWSETNPAGRECQLEATAIGGNPILLIELADHAYAEKQSLLQTGRTLELNYEYFAKETEKKEILLHCILHDLTGQLLTFRFCLELLRIETLSERGRDRLEIGLRQVRQQEALLHEIVQAFEAEIAAPEAPTADAAEAPDLLICIQSVTSTFLPAFTVQNKRLQTQSELDPTQRWQIVGERSRLERVLANLLENALRHTPEGSTVTVTLRQEDEFLCCAIEDQGDGVPSESVKYLFQRFFGGSSRTGKAGLGLYFCRITVEQWGGAIGYAPVAEGGAQFWLRLRRLV